jgi:hypothetical protein
MVKAEKGETCPGKRWNKHSVYLQLASGYRLELEV